MELAGRRIVLGISGGIAAYKAAELVRLFVKAGAEVRVIMTRAAQKFITPLTLQALSQHPVATDLFELTEEASHESKIGHIELADLAELLVIAPASADLIAKLALGLADDLLTTVALASKAPLLIAPAMNVNMWNHPATRANVATLASRGALTVGPGAGELACGWVGSGRMAEPVEVAEACARALGPRDFGGLKMLVTAGPTYEPIDPVRFIGNRSSGKMGFAVARAAARRGAEVTLVAGPTALATPPGVTRVDVESARQMREAVLARAEAQAAIVMVAAVGDYRPREVASEKGKKETLGESPSLALIANPDILAELGARAWPGRRPILIGFAAETEDVERRAVEKRKKKGCDLLCANDVSEPGSGFGTDTNRVLFVGEGGVERLPLLGKDEVAERLLDRAAALMTGKKARG
ncbi:MAG TPA: bifunctional phosphopantothenoylcysteine decarboxylase/phosphopantothenate--cysteine ligase CoaBC [Polyangia bacterium]